tara:strand:- start:364 stop:729 length:366 start_codon:yes stop_codon:yes gene_type:complete
MVKIEIVTDTKERMNESWNYVDNVLKGKIKLDQKKVEKTIIVTPEIFTKIFSPERIKLILKIRKNNLRNIYQLAKEVNRRYEAVYRDIKLLKGFGIIEIKEEDKKKIPIMEKPIKVPMFAG